MIYPLLRTVYDSTLPWPEQSGNGILDAEAADTVAEFGLAPHLHNLLELRGLLGLMPAPFRERLETRRRRDMIGRLYIQAETDRLLRAFESAAVPVMPLKGTAFAERYFGHACARATTDIDLLIRPSDLERAIGLVRTAGYTIAGEAAPSHFHCSFAKPVPGPTPLPVELHWSLLPARTSAFDPETLWRDSIPYGSCAHVRQLSDYRTFYMVVLHGWKHALDSPKYFVDIVQLLHAAGEAVDYERLLRDAAADRTYRRVVHTLSIVYRQFPHLRALKPFPAERTGTLWWNGGGHAESESAASGGGLSRYARLLRYQLLEYDTILHGLSAAGQYWGSVRRAKRNHPVR